MLRTVEERDGSSSRKRDPRAESASTQLTSSVQRRCRSEGASRSAFAELRRTRTHLILPLLQLRSSELHTRHPARYGPRPHGSGVVDLVRRGICNVLVELGGGRRIVTWEVRMKWCEVGWGRKQGPRGFYDVRALEQPLLLFSYRTFHWERYVHRRPVCVWRRWRLHGGTHIWRSRARCVELQAAEVCGQLSIAVPIVGAGGVAGARNRKVRPECGLLVVLAKTKYWRNRGRCK